MDEFENEIELTTKQIEQLIDNGKFDRDIELLEDEDILDVIKWSK